MATSLWRIQLMTFQNKIKQIVVIGCGGTGSFLIPPLCRYLASINFLEDVVLVDGDTYSNSNSDRQMFDVNQVGLNKAEQQAGTILRTMPEFKMNLQYVDTYVGLEELEDLLVENCVVINCGDNNALKPQTIRR